MVLFMKLLLFMLFSTITAIFIFYINFAYILDVYFQWLFDNIQDMQQYDYIVGELYI